MSNLKQLVCKSTWLTWLQNKQLRVLQVYFRTLVNSKASNIRCITWIAHPLETFCFRRKKLMLLTFEKQGNCYLRVFHNKWPRSLVAILSSWQKCRVLLHDGCMTGHVTRRPCVSCHITKCAFPVMGSIFHNLMDEGNGCAALHCFG